jgi:hypothetical protein
MLRTHAFDSDTAYRALQNPVPYKILFKQANDDGKFTTPGLVHCLDLVVILDCSADGHGWCPAEHVFVW